MADWQPVGTRRDRQSVVLDANGNGTITGFQVPSSNHKWRIEDVLVFTDQAQTTAPYPTAKAYIGGQQIGVIEGATWTGNQDIMRGKIELGACDNLLIEFTGGVAASRATAIAEGDLYLWR